MSTAGIMGTVAVNLVPAARLRARRRRRHVRRCAAGCSIYAAAALAAALACRGVWGRADASLPIRLSDAAAAAQRVAKDVAAVRAELDAHSATLRATRSIADQPDWSLLLQLLAAKEGEAIILRECRVLPSDTGPLAQGAPPAPSARGKGKAPRTASKSSGQPPGAPTEPAMVLGITGLGRSQAAVSQFVLRLEGLHLFAKVTLLETSRETFLGGEAVGFRIECSLDAPAAPTATPTAQNGPSAVPAANGRAQSGGRKR